MRVMVAFALILLSSVALAQQSAPALTPDQVFAKEWALWDGGKDHVLEAANKLLDDYRKTKAENAKLKEDLDKATKNTKPTEPPK